MQQQVSIGTGLVKLRFLEDKEFTTSANRLICKDLFTLQYDYKNSCLLCNTLSLLYRWPKYDEFADDHDFGGDKGNEDLEYHPYDDNDYDNSIGVRKYPWEEIGSFGKDHLSTSAEVKWVFLSPILG